MDCTVSLKKAVSQLAISTLANWILAPIAYHNRASLLLNNTVFVVFSVLHRWSLAAAHLNAVCQ